MKHSFLTRAINFTAIAAMLLGYNQVLYAREKEEEIARLEAEVAEAESLAAAASAAEQNALYKDGTYTGSGEGYGGTITVEVTVSGGKISAIDVTEHSQEDGTYYSEAEKITETIIDEQSTDVDLISGATFSSQGILLAAEDALASAEAE